MEETLAENLARKNLEETEVKAIDAILPSLLEQDLITDKECRLITGYNQLLEKQGAVYQVMMSKTKEEAAHLFEIFRTLTVTIHADELSKTPKTSDCEDEQENNSPLLDKPNPLLNDTVLACLFGYLPLDDIKHSRLVCLKWNSVAEISLRKRCTIHFRPNGLKPQIFMEISNNSLPDLPFPAYKFSGGLAWIVNEVEDFCDKWGTKIKEIELKLITLGKSHHTSYNITQWIMKTPNLSSLKLGCDASEAKALFSISIDKLASIKTVFLKNCRILTNGERVSFLPFSNVSLTDVSFERLGSSEAVCKYFCYNEFFDFNQTANLAISNGYQAGVKFDMEDQINKNQLDLRYVTLENWTKAKGEVNWLRLSNWHFIERNDLKITRMSIEHSKVNMSVLPQTLEKLNFGEKVKIVSTEPFQLPNLKCLRIEAYRKNARKLVFLIENCPNLQEMELVDETGSDERQTLDLDCIPRSVKKLKLGIIGFSSMASLGMLDYANGGQILEMDTLVLQSINDLSYCNTILKSIKPKVVVISYYPFEVWLAPSDILDIVLANKQIETIVVGTTQNGANLHKSFQFEGSTFSSYVDKESNCYKFQNQVGHAIDVKEFEDHFNALDDKDDDCFSKLDS